MNKTEVVEALTPIFKTVFNNADIQITETLTANDVKGWNSLTHMILMSSIEEHFAIKFSLREINKMQNVGDLIDLIASKK